MPKLPDGLKVNIVTNPENPVPTEVIAECIVEIAAAMKRLSATRLTRRAIVTLIHAESGIGKGAIEVVLNNLEQLEKVWLKPA